MACVPLAGEAPQESETAYRSGDRRTCKRLRRSGPPSSRGRSLEGAGTRGAGPEWGRDQGRHLGEVAQPRPLALPCAAAPEQEAPAAGIPRAAPGHLPFVPGPGRSPPGLRARPDQTCADHPVHAHPGEPLRETDPPLAGTPGAWPCVER